MHMNNFSDYFDYVNELCNLGVDAMAVGYIDIEWHLANPNVELI